MALPGPVLAERGLHFEVPVATPSGGQVMPDQAGQADGRCG